MSEHLDPEAVRGAFGDALVDFVGESMYAWAPVHRARVATADGVVDAVIKTTWRSPEKVVALNAWQEHLIAAGVAVVAPLRLVDRANPTAYEDRHLVAYPYVEGRPWRADLDDIAAAGALLGRIHRHSADFSHPDFPSLGWPEHDAESVAEDVEAISASYAEHLPEAVTARNRWVAGLESFHATVLPQIADAELPSYPVSLDHRATNLVYGAAGPHLVDLENAEVAPRLLDLAVSALLFSSEIAPSLGRLFNDQEWQAFRDAYLAETPALTEDERRLWPTALDYMLLEWGTWHAGEGAEWDYPGESGVLSDLLQFTADRWPL